MFDKNGLPEYDYNNILYFITGLTKRIYHISYIFLMKPWEIGK